MARSKNEITIYSPTPIQVNKKQLQKTLNTKKSAEWLIFGSIISVVGKTTVGIIELFECTQKVP